MEPLCLWILNNKLNSFATFPTTMMSQRHVCMHRHSLLFKRVQRCGGDFHSADTHTSSTHTHTHTHTRSTLIPKTQYIVAHFCVFTCTLSVLLHAAAVAFWTGQWQTIRAHVQSALRLCLSTFQLHLRQRDMPTKVDLDLGRAHSFSSPID